MREDEIEKVRSGARARLERGLSNLDDIERLRREIEGLNEFSAFEIDRLYHEWSEYAYCAGWLGLSDEHIAEFTSWLMAGTDDAGTV